MKGFRRAFVKKMKGFRPTIISIIMILLATYRLFCSGKGIIIAGACASIVPFICQFRNYPAKDESSSELTNIMADYFVNIFYMLIYLSYVLLVTLIGMKMNPAYVRYSYFWGTMMLAISANMVFMSVIYMIGSFLTAMQRLMIGILMTNAELGVMMLSECIVRGQSQINVYCAGFILLILCLTLSFGWFGSGHFRQ